MRSMKIQKLAYGWCILALLTACQARQVQTKSAVQGNLSGTQAGQTTVLNQNQKRTISKIEVTTQSETLGAIDYVIYPESSAASSTEPAVAYLIDLTQTPSANGSATAAADGSTEAQKPTTYRIDPTTQSVLFQEVNALFLGQVKVATSIPASEATMKIETSEGQKQEILSPAFQGANAENLLAELDQLFQNDQAKVTSTTAATQVQAALQFQKIGVVASDASKGYNITAAENGAFTISVSLDQSKVMNTSISIDASAGKTYQAVSDLMTGKLVLKGKTETAATSQASPTVTYQITLTNLSGATEVVNDPASADSTVASALKAINLYIDERLPETVTELRPTAQTCENIDLAGVWISSLVSGSQVIRVTSTIQAGQSTQGTISYSGTDEANGKSRAMSYRYTPSSCILQKSTKDQQARTFKIIFVGQSPRQIVKLLPCEDQACAQTMENPGYTDMVILRRAK